MHKITVQGLQKRFQQRPVLKDVSFSAVEGEVLALIGDSGAGKSTLLRCLNLLEQPDAGKLALGPLAFNFPEDAAGSRQQLVELRTKVGMVFQQFHLWAHLSILQNLIEAPMQVLKIPKATAIEQAVALLSEVGISDKKDSYPAQLSGGQQQRAAIARALMMQPDVMLFDEPTSALDPKMMIKVTQLIRSIADKGVTVVIATHEMNFVRGVADKTIFLHQGEIVEQGETQAMFQSPQTKAFQHFIQSEQ